MIQETLQSLANSSLWKEARSTYFEEKLVQLKDVTRPIKTETKLTAGEMFAAKVAAATMLEEILDGVDRFANQGKNKEITNYD